MALTCRFSFGDRSGAADWSYDGEQIVVTPEQGGPLSFAVRELDGIAGDGYTLHLTMPGPSPDPASGAASAGVAPGLSPGPEALRAGLLLSRLGADGQTLLERLRREWLSARTKTLRLTGSGQGETISGMVARLPQGPPGGVPGSPALPGSPAVPEPFWGMLYEDVLVVAREGRDLEPLFLSLFGAVDLDEATYSVRIRQWPAEEVVFSKMGRQTEGFVEQLRAGRTLLAEESAAVLAKAVPTLPAGSRGELAGMWLPGRLLEYEAMQAICPGFSDAFSRQWLPALTRREEAQYLLDGSVFDSRWLGCVRQTSSSSGETGAEGSPLWCLSGKNGVWFLEALSSEDRATYCFGGDDEVPALAAKLLCAPRFSKEALYSPLEELVGESAELAIPAQCLGFLVELRRRFRGRVIHRTAEGWRQEVERLAGAASG